MASRVTLLAALLPALQPCLRTRLCRCFLAHNLRLVFLIAFSALEIELQLSQSISSRSCACCHTQTYIAHEDTYWSDCLGRVAVTEKHAVVTCSDVVIICIHGKVVAIQNRHEAMHDADATTSHPQQVTTNSQHVHASTNTRITHTDNTRTNNNQHRQTKRLQA